MEMNPQLFTQPLSDYNLNTLSSRDGLLEVIPLLSLDLPDKYIVQNLHQAIQMSQDYYNDINEFNLKNKRLKNEQMIAGKHLQEHKLYRHQTPYIDNEMFVGIDAIIAYVCAQTPRAEVYPASDKEESKILAKDLETFLHAHSEKFDIPRKLEGAVYNVLTKYVGFIKLRWNPLYGAKGEIVPEIVDPNHVIVDKNAKLGENPRFICHVLKDSIEGLISKFPEKEDDILKLFSIKRKGSQNISAEIAYREVWFTYYDKDHRPQEAVAWYVNDLVLDKCKNPNWLYDEEGDNFLDNPVKPFIPVNINNDGSHWYDKNNALEQAVAQQDILNKLGRQIIDNLATANGFKVLDAHAMRSEDAQNFTGDPNQLLLVKTKPGQAVRDVVEQLPPQLVSNQAIQQNVETRQNVHNILGTPSQFRGDDEDQSKTATQAVMIKNQASGRQDRIVRAVDRAVHDYFNLLTQMICVWYTEKHYATVNGGDGNFDFIEMHKDKIEAGMTVRVEAGTTLPFDKARQESVAQGAAELGLLAPYDYYRLMHMDNPQKLYDNLMKWKSNPQELAMDVANSEASREALIDFTELMAGKKVEQRNDPTYEYLEQLRKQMISDDFLNAKKSLQRTIINFVKKASDSLQRRTELEELSAIAKKSATAPNAQPSEPLPTQIAASGLLPPPPAPVPAMTPPMPPGMPAAGAPVPAIPNAPMPPASPVQALMQGQPALPAPQQGNNIPQLPPV